MRLPEPVSEALRERLLDFERRLDSDARWAVRSSAVAEDLAGASFAGQYDSILGVTGFEEIAGALLRCWASFFNPHALQYRRDRNIRDFRGAVVVQRLIPADAAGVCFTLDPVSGASDRVVVNSNFGLGESVVSGRVTPDTFVVDKLSRRVIDRQVATKTLKVAPTPGGTAEVAIDGIAPGQRQPQRRAGGRGGRAGDPGGRACGPACRHRVGRAQRRTLPAAVPSCYRGRRERWRPRSGTPHLAPGRTGCRN